jgi:hypothetical protein
MIYVILGIIVLVAVVLALGTMYAAYSSDPFAVEDNDFFFDKWEDTP